MNQWFDWKHEVGEMIGMMTIVFSVMMAFHIVKKKSFGITTVFRKRIFLGTTVALSVLLAASVALGFGGHGQINPAVTLMVAALEGYWKEVPAVLGFHIIGAIAGALLLVTFVKLADPKTDLKDAFNWTTQSPQKTVGVELVGNILWLLPIGALLVIMLNSHPTGANFVHQTSTVAEPFKAHSAGLMGIDGSFGHYQLFIVAIAGKFLLVAMFEEYGGAVFNSGVWFGKVVVTLIAHKRIPVKAAISGGAGLVTSLSFGVGVGYFSSLFLK